MLRKFLASFRKSSSPTTVDSPPYSPYASEAANRIYNLLFCDDVGAFLVEPGQRPTSWQRAFAAHPPDIAALKAIAADGAEEGRIRYLANQQLRKAGQPVTPKQLLGVI